LQRKHKESETQICFAVCCAIVRLECWKVVVMLKG